LKAIFAFAEDGSFGCDDGLPWPKIPEDFRQFKTKTLGHTVIMGRGTWESNGMPKPLPGRKNVVLSSSPVTFPAGADCVWIQDPCQAASFQDAWIIGGIGTLNALWPLVTEAHVTRVHGKFDAPVKFDISKLERDFYFVASHDINPCNFEVWKRK